MPKLIGLKDACSQLSVGKDVVRRLADNGLIGYRKLPGTRARKYVAADVARLAASGWHPARPDAFTVGAAGEGEDLGLAWAVANGIGDVHASEARS